MRNDKENLIVDLTFSYALEIIAFSEKLRSLHKYEMASQIFRSGTSVGANIREAQNAESKRDFIHKFKIAAKEADELEYWLLLCDQSEFYPKPEGKLLTELKSIIRITSKIISTSKLNKSSNYQIN
ncbi:MAG: four helix bundle protein [Flavobacteriaceae bacterium]|nr:four helix bundle protein [Flavobacteriaceae bacterium]|tara:strand:- start:202802 stop:203179 length:378 start_codon:yes stop_codon:yes gene_type:complete